MTFDQHIQLTQLFLVANSIFAVALADADNEKLKTGVSIAGLVISLSWLVTNMASIGGSTMGPRAVVGSLFLMAGLAIVGWGWSLKVHASNWRDALKQRQPNAAG